MIGQLRRRAEHVGDAGHDRRVALERGQDRDTRGQARDQRVEAREGGVRFALPTQLGEQARQNLFHQLARPHRAERPDAAGLPSPQRLDDPVRVLESEAAQAVERAGRRLADAAEIETVRLRGRRRHVLEHLGVTPQDAARAAQQRAREAVRVGIAHEHREALQLVDALRQPVRLAVCDHLQAVLHPAQEAVGGE